MNQCQLECIMGQVLESLQHGSLFPKIGKTSRYGHMASYQFDYWNPHWGSFHGPFQKPSQPQQLFRLRTIIKVSNKADSFLGRQVTCLSLRNTGMDCQQSVTTKCDFQFC